MPNEDLIANFSDDQIKQLAALQVALVKSPKTRIATLMNVKTLDPNYALPPDVQIAQLRHELGQKDAKRDHEARVTEVNTRLARGKAGLLDGTTLPGNQFSAEDAEQIEKLMEQHGITDHAIGAKLFLADMKPALRPGERPSAGWEFPQYAGLMEAQSVTQLNKAAMNKAYEVVDELRGRARVA
jgi:hypothetical protein